MYVFNLKSVYDVMKSGRFKGAKMLDIGSGSTVHNIASASAHFPNIILSDLVDENREQLKMWLMGHPNCFDWSYMLDLVAKIESPDSDPKHVRPTLEARIRNSVKGVLKCDLSILSDYIVEVDEKKDYDLSPPYDLVSSFWCLENCAVDFTTYAASLKNINQILKPGGGFILAGFENCVKMYTVGEKPFHCMKISLDDVITALNIAGFVNHDIRIQKKPDRDDENFYDNLFFIATEKQP